jgi:hypothetical protein
MAYQEHKQQQIAGKCVGGKEPLYTTGGNENQFSHYRNQYGGSQ